MPAALTLFVLLGMAAAVHDGAALVWDRPITNACVALRSTGIDRIALWITRLGSTPVVLAAGAAGVLMAGLRSRSVALVMLVTVAARPPLEWGLKEVVGRPRPSGARLVAGTGFSYPSGHVLGAAATWGFIPVIAALYVHRRWLWWALSGLSVSIVVLVAWSRVWLGVHWTSDVVGGLALAFVALSAAEAAIDAHEPPREPSPRWTAWSWPVFAVLALFLLTVERAYQGKRAVANAGSRRSVLAARVTLDHSADRTDHKVVQ